MSNSPRRLRPFVQVDVFSPAPGSGNPLAVVLDGDGLCDARMQAIARWMRLPETTFVLPGDAADSYRIRMFSPQHEVPFAGHPSIGTAHAVLQAGLASPRDGLLWQQGVTGTLPLRVHQAGDGAQIIAVRTPPAAPVEIAERQDPRLAAILHALPAGELPPVLMQGGRRWWFAEVADEASLRAAIPPWAAVTALAEATQSMGICLYARCSGSEYALAVRAWVGGAAAFEDRASGAANAILAAWLATQNALPGTGSDYWASQGREVGADARLHLARDASGDIWSGGQIRSVVRGTLDWGD